MPKRPRIVVQLEADKIPHYYRMAKDEERTLSQLIRYLLNRYLKEANDARAS